VKKRIKTPKTVIEEINMSYDDYVAYLLDKYGPAECSYFCTDACKSTNKKISRTSEGLFCHHVREDTAILLSDPLHAKINPFEFQMAHNLVYCNYLEHLILHVKIVELDHKKPDGPIGLGIEGVTMIYTQLNGIYSYPNKVLRDDWRRAAIEAVQDRYEDYLEVMKYFRHQVISKYPDLIDWCPFPSLSHNWNGKIVRRVYRDVYPEVQKKN
jgi:hypothetical protein